MTLRVFLCLGLTGKPRPASEALPAVGIGGAVQVLKYQGNIVQIRATLAMLGTHLCGGMRIFVYLCESVRCWLLDIQAGGNV